MAVGVKKSTRTNGKTLPNSVEVGICLSSIAGVHPHIKNLYKELEVPLFRHVPAKILTDQDIKDLLSNTPLRLARYNGNLYCISGIRLLEAARRTLPHDEEIKCAVESGVGDRKSVV